MYTKYKIRFIQNKFNVDIKFIILMRFSEAISEAVAILLE